jgi:hypothetical protein
LNATNENDLRGLNVTVKESVSVKASQAFSEGQGDPKNFRWGKAAILEFRAKSVRGVRIAD